MWVQFGRRICARVLSFSPKKGILLYILFIGGTMPETPVLERILFSQEQLSQRVAELGRQISADYRGKMPLFIGILRGCILFYSDLMKQISVDCNMDFMCLSSYSGTSSTEVSVKVSSHLYLVGISCPSSSNFRIVS